MDKLKAYLKETEMNVEVPDASVWDRIEKITAPVTKKASIRSITLRYVAAACIIGLVGLGIWLLQKQESRQSFDTARHKFFLPVAKEDSGTHDQSTAIIEEPPSIKQKGTGSVTTKDKPTITTSPRNPGKRATITTDYDALINAQVTRLRRTPVHAGNPAYFKGLIRHFQQMKKDEQALILDMEQYGLNDELLEELINVNLRKLNALKTLQAEINKMNNRARQEQGTPQNQKTYYLNI